MRKITETNLETVYKKFYDHRELDMLSGFLCEMHDIFMKEDEKYKKAVIDFVQMRHVPLASDRECASFMALWIKRNL